MPSQRCDEELGGRVARRIEMRPEHKGQPDAGARHDSEEKHG